MIDFFWEGGQYSSFNFISVKTVLVSRLFTKSFGYSVINHQTIVVVVVVGEPHQRAVVCLRKKAKG